MNKELIDQIAFQAGCDKHWYNDPTNPDLCGRIISREVLDKFAQLIVRECVALDFYKLAHIGTEDDYRVTQVIKEHFGVEL